MWDFELPSTSQLFSSVLVLAAAANVLYTVLYRLYFHPLAHIPGPKLAAVTFLYQSYFSLVSGSRFYAQIGKLHAAYGPVVRITPDEIHLSDPANYETIYHVGSKYAKYPRFYNAFSLKYSSFTTCPNDVHKLRRGPLNQFFSRKMVLELEDVVQSKAQKLCDLVTQKLSVGQTVDLHHAFRAVSIDVITEYGFNKCYDLLDKPDLGRHFFLMVRGIGPSLWVYQQWPQLQIANNLPPSILKKMSPELAQVLTLQEHAKEQILEVKADLDAGLTKQNARQTIFHGILAPVPEEGYVVPSVDDIKDEAYGILAAAADTTGNGMTVAAYHVVNNPEIYKKLRAELKTAFPDFDSRLNFTELEKLPYLTGVVKEGLRLSFGVISRLARVVPEGGATFNGYPVSAGAAVSMSSWVLHQDPNYFHKPQEFDPERWSNASPAEQRHMEKAFVPFGKGSRICVGMPLAYCEIYVTIAMLFHRFEHLKGNKLTADDLVYDDYFASHHPIDATKFHIVEG
ncbi:cytochrome P450 monooxygenase-like protein [Hyaloscypha finlandica]|nr:cytochrome P450 monooxygenase-like protein [Hyaloscypha finlandica]